MVLRIRVNGYKSLHNVDLPLSPLTVIIGPNAAGKSNLFDAMRLLSRMLTSRSLQDAFEDHRGDPLEAFDYSEGGISKLLEKERVAFSMEVDVHLSEKTVEQTEHLVRIYRSSQPHGSRKGKQKKITERFLRYRIVVEIQPKTGVMRVVDERLEALTRSASGDLRPKSSRRPFLEKVGNRLRLRMEGQARPTEYDIGLNYPVASQPVYPPHYPHLVAFREEVSRWRFYYFEPRVMREESPVKEVHELQLSGGDLAAFYYTLQRRNPIQFENLQRTLRSLIPSVERVEAELTEEGRIRLKVRERGVEFTAKVVSEGTLRILALLAIFNPMNPATLIGLEEPENGVHPRRLKLIADILKNASEHRQVLVNTHSPLLPDFLEDAYLVRCLKEDGHSVFEPMSTSGTIFRQVEVAKALDESTIAERILRGDWE